MPKTDPIEITKQHWSPDAKPLVSVCNWVYNHKDYIKQSIDSILMQKTTFQVEIIIQDDASNDGTREIIEEYAIRYPHLFNNILFEENQYSQDKDITIGLFNKASGKYIALAHGDDYWTDPYKLQKQVDFLEENQEYVLCGGKVNILDSRNQNNKLQYDQQYFVYDKCQEIEKSHCIHGFLLPFHTSTYVFRQSALNFNQLKRIQKNCISGDIIILNLLNSNGKIYYINNIFGVQHHNANGTTTHENHKGLNFLWNRVYMWRKIAKIAYSKSEFLKKSALRLSLNFEIILIGKIGNQSLSKRISFVRNTHYGQLRLFFLVLKLHIEKLIS